MEMHHLPFKPRTLTLAIAASLLASQPSLRVYADEAPDTEWSCVPAASGNGWECLSTPRKQGIIKRAPLPAAVPDKQDSVSSKPEKQQQKVASTVTQKPASTSLKTTLDWVPYSKLTPAQKEQQPCFSCGAYIEPERPGKDFKGDPDTQPIVAEANTSNYDQESITTLEGKVRIQQASRQLESDKIVLDKNKNHATFEGDTRLREPGVLILGDRGEAWLDSGRATVENATYVLHDSKLRGQASTVTRNEDTTMDLTDATYTYCPPEDEGWLLSGKNVKLDPITGFGTARDATIRVQGLPILYTPYIYFPIDDRRQSGFLYPSFGSDSDNGLDFSIPYYLNLAPNYDATITPRMLSKRGFLVETEARYLTERNEGELGFAGIAGKDQLKKENPYYDKDRWLVNWRHNTRLTSQWDVEVDYADASDKGYLEDFGSQLNLSGTGPLNQRVQTRYIGGDENYDWQFRIAAHKYKNMSRTSDDPYNKLPQLELKGNWQAGENVNIGYLADYTKFSRDDKWRFLHETPDPDFDLADKVNKSIYDEGYGITRAEGERMYLETGASYPMQWSYAFLTPAVKVRHVQYNLSNLVRSEVENDLSGSYPGTFKPGDYTESPKTTVPAVSLDGGLYFDRLTSIGSTQFTHTLEPRMKYLYAPYVEGQEMNPIFDTAQMGFNYSSLWRDNRFSGYDRLADANQLSLGVTTRLMEDDGFERARFGIGQIVYFKDRKVYIDPTTGNKKQSDWDSDLTAEQKKLRDELDDPTSPVASELVYNINRSMSLRQDLVWDANENEIDNYGLYYRYHPEGGRKAINVGYRYRDQVDRYVKNSRNQNVEDPNNPGSYLTTTNNLSQSDFSFAWPVTNNWSALGRWQYDLTNKRNLEILSGVEYNSCCYQVRLLWRSWIEPDDNIDHPNAKSGVFLQFVLMGLGDLTGGSVNDYLNGIQGYRQREK